MLESIFATKSSMTQAWTTTTKRLAVTRLQVQPNCVVSALENQKFLIGYGPKKLKNMKKPARQQISGAGFSLGVKQLRAVKAVAGQDDEQIKAGVTIKMSDVLQVGDVVNVQGITKGKGFAGGMKRHGFKGGPKTHGQSDRARAVGSIGSGTTPGRVWKGKRMPGHMGDVTRTVKGLVVVHLDEGKQEVWLNGPVPGSYNSTLKLIKTGRTKKIDLDHQASGIEVKKTEEVSADSENQEVKES